MKKMCLLFLLCSNGSFAQISVYFGQESFVPDKKEKTKLDSIAGSFNKQSEQVINIKAYTDTTAGWAFNMSLSQQRALYVKRYLTEKGIPSWRVFTKNMGECSSHLNMRQNRRADIFIIEKTPTLAEILGVENRNQQYYNFDAAAGAELRCEAGTVVRIPPNSLVYTNGQPAKGPVNLTIREYYNPGDYIRQGLFTESQGKLLQSGGVIDIKAEAQGKPLRFAKGMKMALGYNTAPASNMRAFYMMSAGCFPQACTWFEDLLSQVPGKRQNGEEIWIIDSVRIYASAEYNDSVFIDSMAARNSNFKFYRFIERKLPTIYADRFGLINCDKFIDRPDAEITEMFVNVKDTFQRPDVYMIFPETLSVLPMRKNARGTYTSGKMKMPRGPVFFIAVYKSGQNFYLGKTSAMVTGGMEVKIGLEEVPYETISQTLSSFTM